MTQLNQACKLRLTKAVRALIDAKAPIDKWAIHYAANSGHTEIVRMLEDELELRSAAL